jgi:ABC-type amino acid transport substrate-binding protein
VHKLLQLFVALLAVTLMSPLVVARPLDEITASGEITIFVYADYAPYSWKDGDEIKGIDADLARAMAKHLGVKLNILIRAADENVDDDLRVNIWKGDLIHRKAADVMLHVPYDRELERRAETRAILFNPYFGEQIAVVVDADKLPEVKTYGRFTATPIAVELDTAGDFFLSNAFRGQLHQSIRRGRTFFDAVALIESNETPALMASRAQTEWVKFRNPERNFKIVQPPAPGLVRRQWPIGMAVREDSRDLGYALGDVITALKESGELEAIFARYGVKLLEPVIK